MANPSRKVAFVTVATDHGTLIVNRFDYHMLDQARGVGCGFQLFNTSCYDPGEVALAHKLLDLRRHYYSDGVIAVDCGANIGVFTIEWAKHMTGWGIVIAFEAQERIYYALAGNIAINNCFNARAIHAAVGSELGMMKIPKPNYFAPGSFGSLELRKREDTEFIGQVVDYSEASLVPVQTTTVDSFNFPRLDLLKLDIEGMELDALAGASECIAGHRPILVVESLKCDKQALRALLERYGYSVFDLGMNFLAVHKIDKCMEHLKVDANGKLASII